MARLRGKTGGLARPIGKGSARLGFVTGAVVTGASGETMIASRTGGTAGQRAANRARIRTAIRAERARTGRVSAKVRNARANG
jgi:hypothetical protein